jgi:diguanylate cyclase (GGDEF)-like protein
VARETTLVCAILACVSTPLSGTPVPLEEPEPTGDEEAPADAALSRRLVLGRRAVAAGLAGTGAGLLWLTVQGQPGLLEIATLVAFAVLCAAIGVTIVTERAILRRRLEREAGIRRFAARLSRSVSADSVVDTIITDLRAATDADHVVVARVRQPDESVEVTLVSATAATPPSRTWLRSEIEPRAPAAPRVGPLRGPPEGIDEDEPPRVVAQAAAEEIARRVRSAYGLPFTLTRPLMSGRRFVGALLLSRRSRRPWSGADQRLLGWAAEEVSAAFARAYAMEAAERGANIDALTGLPNRRYFDEVLAIERPRRRSSDSLGMLMIDIDHFKRLNDQHGHSTGDRVLRAVAGAIASQVRADDTPARYGGEEFAVLLRRASAEQATEVGERIRLAVSRLNPASMGVAAPVTVSVGLAVASPGEPDAAALVDRADQALYRAKRLGRDRVVAA